MKVVGFNDLFNDYCGEKWLLKSYLLPSHLIVLKVMTTFFDDITIPSVYDDEKQQICYKIIKRADYYTLDSLY
jgi:hypothetical protein